ncbi:AAA family ATPase [bacterium]|nr:AAA family ATPase [bacterium]
MKILLTGLPGSGKTTVIKKIAERLGDGAVGFYTGEIRVKGRRVGFKIRTLSGREGVLAHIDIKAQYKVSKYGVNIEDLESIGVKELRRGLKEKKVIIIDEIGKMELYSKSFREILNNILNSELDIVATVIYEPNPFADKV